MEDYTAETNLTSQIKANEIIKKKNPAETIEIYLSQCIH